MNIKLNESNEIRLRYAVADSKSPDAWDDSFWTKGGTLVDIYGLEQNIDIFDDSKSAENLAHEVLKDIQDSEVFVVSIDEGGTTDFIKCISKSKDSQDNLKESNSGVLYAIAYCEDPDIYSEEFWGWDTESDVGYELMEFGSLIQDADVFDSLEAAEDRADDVLSSIFEDEVFIVGLDPYTPHNLTGFVKKIIRDSVNESKSMDETIKVGDKVKVSTPGNDYYNGRTGVVDYTEDGIVTVKFDDNNSPRLNNFDLNQVIRINESKSIKESNINTKTLIVCPSCKSSDDIILTGPAAFADYDKYLYQPCTCDKCGCKFEANFKEVTDYNVISQGTLDLDESTVNTNENTGYNPEYSNYIEEVAQRIDAGEYDDIYEVCEYVANKFNKDINIVKDDINKLISGSKSIKESNRIPISSIARDYVEVAYICDGFTNFRVFGGGFKTSDALVSVEDDKGKRLRLTMSDVCEFYTWYDAKGNVIHEPTYYSED